MGFKNAFGALALSVAVLAAAPASAVVYSQGGTLTLSDPTFNRPLDGNPPAGLSAVGTAVHYDTLTFTVNVSGNYAFLMNSGTGGFDTFFGLYSGSFSAASPLTNALQYNDDFGGTSLTTSGFTRALTAGTSYIAILTAFDNADLGGYTLTIDGPGTVTPRAGAVPEPATWGMMLLGFGAIGGAMRYRRAKRTVRYA